MEITENPHSFIASALESATMGFGLDAIEKMVLNLDAYVNIGRNHDNTKYRVGFGFGKDDQATERGWIWYGTGTGTNVAEAVQAALIDIHTTR